MLSNNECNIRKSIISYSAENTIQKIWEVQGIPCLRKIEGLSDSHKPYHPPVCLWQNHPPLKKKKAVKEKNLQPPLLFFPKKLVSYLTPSRFTPN